MDSNCYLLTKHVLLGCALSLLLLTLQLEIKLLLALHCRKKVNKKLRKLSQIVGQEVRALTRFQMNAIPVREGQRLC